MTREMEARQEGNKKMIGKLAAAALLALVAAPAVSLWQAGAGGFEAPRLSLELGGARTVSVGALLSTGLI